MDINSGIHSVIHMYLLSVCEIGQIRDFSFLPSKVLGFAHLILFIIPGFSIINYKAFYFSSQYEGETDPPGWAYIRCKTFTKDLRKVKKNMEMAVA